jgi:hypothetical protein
MEMSGEALRGIGNPDTWVIASAGALEYARQGLFAKGFLRCGAAGLVSLETIVQAVSGA